MFLLTGIILYAGKNLPLEMKLIYYVQIISKNFYLTFLGSFLLSVLGYKIMTIEKYEPSTLTIDNFKMKFDLGEKVIVVRTNRITDFYQLKSKEQIKLRIETSTFRTVNLRMDKENFESLLNISQLKIKTLGNNV